MNDKRVALEELVAKGLDDGWVRAHQLKRQPSKSQLLGQLQAAVVDQLMRLVERAKSTKVEGPAQ